MTANVTILCRPLAGPPPCSGKLRAAEHAGVVVSAAGHQRPALRSARRRKELRHVELREDLAALPAEEALRRDTSCVSCWGADSHSDIAAHTRYHASSAAQLYTVPLGTSTGS